MAGFVAGLDRGETTLLPECLDDWVDENNSVRAVDVFVEALDLRDLGFEGVDAAGIGRPPYRPGGNRCSPTALRAEVIGIIRERYSDFGPTLAAEKLAELHGIDLARETVRQWMLAAGLWKVGRAR